MLIMIAAFGLELAVYAAAGYWGFTCSRRWPVRVLAGVGAPVLFALVWGWFGAPTATYPVQGLGRVALEVLWFGGGAAALWLRGRRTLAVAFVAVYLVTTGAQLL
ncbi:hypothetical protein GCM10010168_74090 [Actinoplanes ianthinogenes]|uniref:DUF2568 domain-containing protein n=1 Tax=Actinoplanes ianthinogenes TaxID=122358 RepID=A0ABN6C6A4_9ACTN|nr:YrdB family protein [Actinoplanes ianthinogenes]BCJ40603.1 hypothetical protein Aiant_12600 [Actinoplanes ianthinogenes]GGR44181.1 hypothetical protein GCM10010168_74090 [Actinoplanes ianthinogenes]